jgi:hypothetical protein
LRKPIVLIILLLIGTMASVARADTVEFSTSWNLDIQGQESKLSNMNLAFSGVGLGSLLPVSVDTPTYASLGSFLITGVLGSDTFVNVPFDLVINQYVPSTGTAQFSSVIDGTIKLGQSSAEVVFLEPFVMIGDVVYTLTDQTYTLNADSLWNPFSGVTTVQAAITMTPEPGNLLLLGTGFLVLAFVFRRARRSGMLLNFK